jgi:hypothetical protein
MLTSILCYAMLAGQWIRLRCFAAHFYISMSSYLHFLYFLTNFSNSSSEWQGLKDANKQDSAVPAIDTIVELLERSSNDNQVSDAHSLSFSSPVLSLFPSPYLSLCIYISVFHALLSSLSFSATIAPILST